MKKRQTKWQPNLHVVVNRIQHLRSLVLTLTLIYSAKIACITKIVG